MSALTLQAFEEAHPDIAAWWSGTRFDFALSLKNQVFNGKTLTERQMDAAKRCAARFAEGRPQAVSLDIQKLERAFARAHSKGLQRPRLRLLQAEYQFIITLGTRGVFYVKTSDSLYYGKITPGQPTRGAFEKTNLCTPAIQDAILAALENIEEAAVRYGHATGSCSCCGRPLSNPLSVKLGIGPICRGHFFGA